MIDPKTDLYQQSSRDDRHSATHGIMRSYRNIMISVWPIPARQPLCTTIAYHSIGF